jgi:hypothetical protein
VPHSDAGRPPAWVRLAGTASMCWGVTGRGDDRRRGRCRITPLLCSESTGSLVAERFSELTSGTFCQFRVADKVGRPVQGVPGRGDRRRADASGPRSGSAQPGADHSPEQGPTCGPRHDGEAARGGWQWSMNGGQEAAARSAPATTFDRQPLAGCRCRAVGGAGRGMLMSKDAIADVCGPSPT